MHWSRFYCHPYNVCAITSVIVEVILFPIVFPLNGLNTLPSMWHMRLLASFLFLAFAVVWERSSVSKRMLAFEKFLNSEDPNCVRNLSAVYDFVIVRPSFPLGLLFFVRQFSAKECEHNARVLREVACLSGKSEKERIGRLASLWIRALHCESAPYFSFRDHCSLMNQLRVS